MSCMRYKGYAARIEYDARDDIFVGRVLGMRDIISFTQARCPSCMRRFAMRWKITWPIVQSRALRRKSLPRAK